jgi:undecaprenyl-diphosphatase
MSSAALAAVVVALTWPTRWRWPALAASALFTVVVGFSRVYLGVHYPSDVVGGWALSLAFVSATYLAAYRRSRAVGMGPAPLSSDTD